MRTVLARILLSLTATAVAAVLVEGLLRTGALGTVGLVPDLVTKQDIARANWRQPGKPFVWSGQLGREREFRVASRWNSLGYNDGDYPFAKPPDCLRILVLGDSYVEAVQVPQDKSFHNLLEGRLNRTAPPPVEVIALGTSGAGARRSLATLRSLGAKYEPDIVVFEFLAFNDVSDDSDVLSAAANDQVDRLSKISSRIYLPEVWRGDGPWARSLHLSESRLAVLFGQGWNGLAYRWRMSRLEPRDRFPHHWFAFRKSYDLTDPYERAWSEGWSSTLGLLAEAKAASDAAGAKFLLVRFTDSSRVAPGGIAELYSAFPAMAAVEMDFDKDARLLESLTRDLGIEYLDLFPEFRKHWSGERPLHFPSDSHWTEAGHEVAEAAIERRLRELGWIAGR